MLHRTLPYWLSELYQFARNWFNWYIGIHSMWTKATIFLWKSPNSHAAQQHIGMEIGFSVAIRGALV
jgi:hypothetical protein